MWQKIIGNHFSTLKNIDQYCNIHISRKKIYNSKPLLQITKKTCIKQIRSVFEVNITCFNSSDTSRSLNKPYDWKQTPLTIFNNLFIKIIAFRSVEGFTVFIHHIFMSINKSRHSVNTLKKAWSWYRAICRLTSCKQFKAAKYCWRSRQMYYDLPIHESLNGYLTNLMASNEIFIVQLTVRCRVINLHDHDTWFKHQVHRFYTLPDTLMRVVVTYSWRSVGLLLSWTELQKCIGSHIFQHEFGLLHWLFGN